jgi:hypothetical protein
MSQLCAALAILHRACALSFERTIIKPDRASIVIRAEVDLDDGGICWGGCTHGQLRPIAVTLKYERSGAGNKRVGAGQKNIFFTRHSRKSRRKFSVQIDVCCNLLKQNLVKTNYERASSLRHLDA